MDKATATFKAFGFEVETPIQRRARVRCFRRNGPPYSDQFEQGREFARIDCLEGRPRRGRSPKALVERRGAA